MKQAPSDKEKRYDRQLRLWAARGQDALESAHVVLINSGCGIVGVEALKNVILPGVGKFTIIDESRITEIDLGANFFAEESDLGKSRAAHCTDILLELNPDVKGDWYPKNEEPLDLGELLDKLSTVTVILYALPIEKGSLAAIHEYQRSRTIPLVSAHSCGFYSYFRIDFPQVFPIIETHPESSAAIDLRLLTPWSELSQFALNMTSQIDSLDDHDHGHLPYIVVILHYLKIWADEHDNKPPSTLREKATFKQMIESGMRRHVPGNMEENFEEAITMLRRVLTTSSINSSLHELFELSKTKQNVPGFWAICQAVRRFHETHKTLPLPGSLPDMKAQSSVYVRLQRIYKDKAQQDAAEVLKLVRELPTGADVDPQDVEIFCRNAAFAKFIRPSPASRDRLAELAGKMLEDDKLADETGLSPSLLPVFVALRAASHIMSSPSKEEILAEMEEILVGAAQDKRLVKAAEEVSRAAGGELHNISAFTGGLVGQELIKIITQQYVPIDNTCIFDGTSSQCQVIRT